MKNLRLLSSFAAIALAGCAITADPPAPPPTMPLAWAEPAPTQAEAIARDWWRSYESAELAALVEAALVASPDMAIATERVLQAEAQARIAGASLFPALNFSAGGGHRETRADGASWQRDSSSAVGLSASYELDLWGRNASGVRSAEASLRATRFDAETTRLTLVAGVTSGYFQLLSIRGRLAIARSNIAIAERVLKVVDSRVRNGAVSPLDLARQQAAYLAQLAALPQLELQERQTIYALAILRGTTPEGFEAVGTSVAAIRVPQVPAGLPADLLVRRPDLASAEAQLAAANANIAAARAALLPGISLTASAGLASNVLVNFLNAPTATLAIGASLMQPIFDGGRLRSQVAIAESRERELVEGYRAFVYAALADVESSLAAVSRSAEQERLQEQVVVQARRALQLAEVRYREGADDLVTLLDAQRTLFAAEDQLAQVRLSRLLAGVGLYKALGGGWTMPATTS